MLLEEIREPSSAIRKLDVGTAQGFAIGCQVDNGFGVGFDGGGAGQEGSGISGGR